MSLFFGENHEQVQRCRPSELRYDHDSAKCVAIASKITTTKAHVLITRDFFNKNQARLRIMNTDSGIRNVTVRKRQRPRRLCIRLGVGNLKLFQCTSPVHHCLVSGRDPMFRMWQAESDKKNGLGGGRRATGN